MNGKSHSSRETTVKGTVSGVDLCEVQSQVFAPKKLLSKGLSFLSFTLSLFLFVFCLFGSQSQKVEEYNPLFQM